ncbi:hypothetical protein KSB_82390 [Ktedonobacter robiniae]|uniref:Uncharacterized protein n=1 Tax=Ktedonobacter robiniae TaxID=2778365 RepID=A0ABQ3V3M1_9CHLR|nr:hypothetical protein KSB_82390 [Ktedonobacter robiniae]
MLLIGNQTKIIPEKQSQSEAAGEEKVTFQFLSLSTERARLGNRSIDKKRWFFYGK